MSKTLIDPQNVSLIGEIVARPGERLSNIVSSKNPEELSVCLLL